MFHGSTQVLFSTSQIKSKSCDPNIPVAKEAGSSFIQLEELLLLGTEFKHNNMWPRDAGLAG